MERFKMIASSYLIFKDHGKILLSRRFQTGYEDGKHSLYSGYTEEYETGDEVLLIDMSITL